MIQLGLETFKENVRELARPNRFMLAFSGTGADIAGFPENVHYLVQSASLPGKTVGNIEINWFGQKYNVGGDISFDDYTVTFLQDYEFKIRNSIEKWMNLVANHKDGLRSDHLDYKDTFIEIHQLGLTQNEGAIRKYKLSGVFPITMAANELSMDSNDEVEKLEVTFKYDSWELV